MDKVDPDALRAMMTMLGIGIVIGVGIGILMAPDRVRVVRFVDVPMPAEGEIGCELPPGTGTVELVPKGTH